MSRYFPGRLLAIETSCDETSIAVLRGHEILSNIVSSQIDLHAQWGGVVPEAAARAHVEALLPVLQTALDSAGVGLHEIEAIAVTNRPGLVGALSVGVSAATALSLSLGCPLIGVHHLEGHIWSVLAADPELQAPFCCLLASGGHTEFVHVRGLGDYGLLGSTIDDAAGEAFDKGARLLGLGSPGGPMVERAAVGGDPKRYPLPRALPERPYEVSFSGLKTALLRLTEREGSDLNVSDAAASLQAAIVDVLAEKALAAALDSGSSTLALVGGVAANTVLREALAARCEKEGIRFIVPPRELCTDNAAMTGLAGSLYLAAGTPNDLPLEVSSNAELGP